MTWISAEAAQEEKELYAYIDGRNAARRGEPKQPPNYKNDLCRVNWECGYDDAWAEMQKEERG